MLEDKYTNKGGKNMTAIRQEVLRFIDELPDNKLEALRPILMLLADETIRIDREKFVENFVRRFAENAS